MKNVHILPTDKPSRLKQNKITKKYSLVTKGIDLTSYIPLNIYISNDEKPKEGIDQWYLDKVLNEPYNSGGAQYSSKQDVIILTTDQDLIKDSVQAIDDEFLEWFVNNPSCKSVEVIKIEDKLISPKNPKITFNALQDPPSFISVESLNNMILTYKYKIIIPKEEPKQDLEKEMFELEKELDIPSNLRWHNSKPK
jgi:hypothetical protein